MSVKLLGAAVAELERRQPWLDPAEVDQREAALARARAALGEQAFARAWAERQAMSLEQAVQYALQEGKGA